MKKLLLLVGLVVFLTPIVVNAENNFLDKFYYKKEQYLGCERGFSFRILKKNILFFDLSKVVVNISEMWTLYLVKTNFNDDFIEGEVPWENALDKFKIYPNEPMVEYTCFYNNNITIHSLLKFSNTHTLCIHWGMYN